MITNCRKFTTIITLYGIYDFHFYHWNAFKVTVRTRNALPIFFGHVGCGLTTRQITLTSLIRRQPITIDHRRRNGLKTEGAHLFRRRKILFKSAPPLLACAQCPPPVGWAQLGTKGAQTGWVSYFTAFILSA